MKIKILYSHIHSQGPSDYKNRLQDFYFEKCFENFISSIRDQDLELHIVYDQSNGEIEKNWLDKYVPYVSGNKKLGDPRIHIHVINGGSMFAAAKEMYRIAKELSEDMEDGDLFYFCENDYLHVPGWLEEIKTLFQTFNLDGAYVSTYDHGDKYILPMYEDLVSKIIVTKSRHWRTVPSTCGTYCVNKKTFLEDYDIRTTLEGDHNYYLYMAEQKNRFVLTPIPSLSTHCMAGLEAPTINWNQYFNN